MKIKSLQALRTIAFLGIFLCHASCKIEWATLGVSIFYVLSGYLMMKNYSDKKIDNSFKFSINKIKKLYPLHIITMSLMIILLLYTLYIGNNPLIEYIKLFGESILNIFLIQTWIPNSNINVSLNGVAWYLSVTMFLYFMFPYIRNWINKRKNKTLILTNILVLLFQIISCIPMIYFFGESSKVYIWFMYCFPVFRLGDFFIGCSLSKLNINNKNKSIIKYSIIELIMFVLTILICIFMKKDFDNILLISLKNWTTLNIIISVIWIYLFVINKGIITKLFNNPLFIKIGNITAYLFLIHYVLIKYINFIIERNHLVINNYILIIFEFLVSVLLSLLFIKIKNKKHILK